MTVNQDPCPPLSLATQYKFWAWVYKQNYKEKRMLENK